MENRPAAVEVVGPPGAGKTALRDAFRASPGTVLPVHLYWRIERTPLFVRSALSLASLILGRGLGGSSRRKIAAWMIRLESSIALLERAARSGVPVVLFDQGPVYTLVRIRAALPPPVRGRRFQHWWSGIVDVWAHRLDLLVVLDAPDEVLLQRIRTRRKPHVLKNESPVTAREGLTIERAQLQAVVADIRHRRPVRMLRFDTSTEPLERIAGQTMAELVGVGHVPEGLPLGSS